MKMVYQNRRRPTFAFCAIGKELILCLNYISLINQSPAVVYTHHAEIKRWADKLTFAQVEEALLNGEPLDLNVI